MSCPNYELAEFAVRGARVHVHRVTRVQNQLLAAQTPTVRRVEKLLKAKTAPFFSVLRRGSP